MKKVILTNVPAIITVIVLTAIVAAAIILHNSGLIQISSY